MSADADLVARVRAAAERHGVALPAVLCSDLAGLLDEEAFVRAPTRSERAGGPTTWSDGHDAPTADLDLLPERYERLGSLGEGGMGQVLRVRDLVLRRVVAMKVCRRQLAPAARSRFTAEAQVTSQLEHPGIVPVFDLGRLVTGEPYYTMPVIEGRTLSAVIAEHHRDATRVSLRRLVALLHDVCAAMAHAHARGVIHRDLKPDNVMVGEHGETLIVDWGVAKVLGQDDPVDVASAGPTLAEPVGTLYGTVIGTPAYMAPEQARGDLATVDRRADVHCLGAMLFEVLTGRRPYVGKERFDVVARILHDPVPHPSGRAEIPSELAELCVRAIAKAPDDRPADAGILAKALEAWLDGARRRDHALAFVERAASLAAEIQADREAGAERERAARAALAHVPAWASAADKRAAWQLEDDASALRHRAEVRQVERVLALRTALTHEPDLDESHRALAAYYRGQHEAAEGAGDRLAADQAEVMLRTHDRGEHHDYLAGKGWVTVLTDPPGAAVSAFRLEVRDRRLVPVPWGRLGATPLRAVELPIGSWLLVLQHPERVEVRYPVRVRRLGHWDGVPPGATEPLPIPLPSAGDLGPDDRYVPPGTFRAGGDPVAIHPRPAADVWVPGFVARRFPVTNAELLGFLDALGPDADAHVPEGGAFTRRDGRFVLGADADGDPWRPDWPVCRVAWSTAAAFAAWEAARTDRPWRLPWELEWEKAARGVDGRSFPWGEHLDPSWCTIRESHAGQPSPQPVHACPEDRSVYGLRAVAGGVSEWCLDPFDPGGPATPSDVPPASVDRAVRGGNWASGARISRVASRLQQGSGHGDALTGFRLFRRWPA